MNLYNLHTDPEQLIGNDKQHLIPQVALSMLVNDDGGYIPDDVIDQAETAIAKDAETAYAYVESDGEPWPMGEPAIATNFELAMDYAKYILQGERFPLAEPLMLTDPSWAMDYAQEIINGRWPEAEHVIQQDPKIWDRYKYRNGME